LVGRSRSGGGSFLHPFETLVVIGAHGVQFPFKFLVAHYQPFDLDRQLRDRPFEHIHSSIELSPIIAALCGGHVRHHKAGRDDKADQSALEKYRHLAPLFATKPVKQLGA